LEINRRKRRTKSTLIRKLQLKVDLERQWDKIHQEIKIHPQTAPL